PRAPVTALPTYYAPRVAPLCADRRRERRKPRRGRLRPQRLQDRRRNPAGCRPQPASREHPGGGKTRSVACACCGTGRPSRPSGLTKDALLHVPSPASTRVPDEAEFVEARLAFGAGIAVPLL